MASKKGMLLINTRFNEKDGLIRYTPTDTIHCLGPVEWTCRL